MPGPLIVQPPYPEWMDPKRATVFDAPWQGVFRKVVGMLGLDDPNQVMALGTPMELGANTGGLIDALAAKFPRFANALKVYHGSPHDFQPQPGAPLGRFDMSKIGTGEGAQSYGHGLYFAENPKVAGNYKDALVKPLIGGLPAEDVRNAEPKTIYDMLRKVRETNPAATFADASKAWDTQSHRSRVLDNVVSYGDNARRYIKDPKTLALYDQMLHSGELQFPKGKMYEVAINAHPDQFLDWDKPLIQQSPAVQDALAKIDPDTYHPSGRDYDPTESGQQTYHRLWQSNILTGEAKPAIGKMAETSQTLKKAGITGIKYLDQGSRAAGEGSRNYVMFDDQPIDILKKYGLLPPAAGAAMGLNQQKDQQ